MKRKMLDRGPLTADEEVWDTGERRTETSENIWGKVNHTYHKVKRKGFCGLPYYSWVHELSLEECPTVEYWKEKE